MRFQQVLNFLIKDFQQVFPKNFATHCFPKASASTSSLSATDDVQRECILKFSLF